MASERAEAHQPDLEEMARMWSGGGRRRYIFPAVWLVYLGQAIDGVAHHAHGWGAAAGYVVVGAFAVSYLTALPLAWQGGSRVFWPLYAVCCGLTIVESFFAHADSLVFCVYIAVLTVAIRTRLTVPIVLALGTIALVLPRYVPGWGHALGWGTALATVLVALAMAGFFRIVQANIALAAARAEVARLAAENERSRIARDLHDLLGHSLTTITVKAGLARRLAEHGDAARSLQEIVEVEQLSRRTLGDVRAAVAGHREVTLTGELATAREVLRAAAIAAELPGSVDVVDSDLSEVFGWVLREGVTNLVRHSRAASCRVTLGARWIEIADNGRGSTPGFGNGLTGLRERLDAVGGTLHAGSTGTGFVLRAEVPAARPTRPDRSPRAEAAQP
jgi:two-component system sensor histidine kinase DesK